jgi:mycofactocin precursor
VTEPKESAMSERPEVTEQSASAQPAEDEAVAELLVEEVSIDGMCGVY